VKVTAKATRSGDWWAVAVPEVEGVFTQVKRLDQVADMAADAVALMLEVAPESIEVEVVPELGDVQREVAEATAAAEEAAAAQARASSLLRSVVATLRRDQSLSTRDVALILGLSHQRVSQLESAPAAPSGKGKAARTARTGRFVSQVAAARHPRTTVVGRSVKSARVTTRASSSSTEVPAK
jgi:predicted RNase H-like HicB family nuclease